MITSAGRWLAVTLAVYAVFAWALGSLFDAGTSLAVLIGGLTGTAVQWWQQWRRPEDRDRQRVVAERWLPGALCAAVAAACGVAALLRGDWTDALPAVPLLVIGAVTVRIAGQRLVDAARWLAEPPYPLDAVPVEG